MKPLTVKFSGAFVSLIACLLLTAATLAVYSQLSGHQLQDFDDGIYLFDNVYVLDGLKWSGIYWAFTNFDAANWHPLTWISHMADRTLFGSHPAAYILENAAWHAAVGCLVFVFFKRLLRNQWLAFAIAAVFVVHPVNVEVVAWASQRKSLLSTFFWFLSLLAYLNYVEKPTRPNYSIIAITFLLGLLCKPTGVSLPIILIMLDFWPLNRIRIPDSDETSATAGNISLTQAIREKIPLVIIAVAICLATFVAQKAGGAVVSVENLSIPQRIINTIDGYWAYLGLFFWPLKLCMFYPHSEQTLAMHAAKLAVLIGITITAISWRRQAPWFLFGWLWYGVIMIPMIGLVQVGAQAYADRYLYIPEIGLALICAIGAKRLIQFSNGKLQPYVCAAAAVAIALLGFRAFDQVKTWETGVTLFQHAIRVAGPTSSTVTNLGVSYLRDGKNEEALGCFNLIPDEFRPDVTLGNRAAATLALGRTKEAIEIFERAVKINPDRPTYHMTLAREYKNLGDYSLALAHYDAAVRWLASKHKFSLNQDFASTIVAADALAYEELRKKIHSPTAQVH